jgi:hypothetical protein
MERLDSHWKDFREISYLRIFRKSGVLAVHPAYPAIGQLVFLDPRTNAEFFPKIRIALHASHAVFLTLTLKYPRKPSPLAVIKISS